MNKVKNLAYILMICLLVIGIPLSARRGGRGRSGSAHSMSKPVSSSRNIRPTTSVSRTSRIRVNASPRLTTARATQRHNTVSRQVAARRRQVSTKQSSRRTNGRRKYHNGRRHHGYRRYRRHGYNFWSTYPLAWWPFYTGIGLAFDNSCAVFNDTAYPVTIYTSSTPQLRLPAGEFLYLPCGDIATIVSSRGSITSNIYDNMSIIDDGAGVFVD